MIKLLFLSILLLINSYGQSKQDKKLTKSLNALIPKRLTAINNL